MFMDTLSKSLENYLDETERMHTLLDTVCSEEGTSMEDAPFQSIVSMEVAFDCTTTRGKKYVQDVIIKFLTNEETTFLCAYRVWWQDNGRYVKDEVAFPSLCHHRREAVLDSIRTFISAEETADPSSVLEMFEEKLLQSWDT